MLTNQYSFVLGYICYGDKRDLESRALKVIKIWLDAKTFETNDKAN